MARRASTNAGKIIAPRRRRRSADVSPRLQPMSTAPPTRRETIARRPCSGCSVTRRLRLATRRNGPMASTAGWARKDRRGPREPSARAPGRRRKARKKSDARARGSEKSSFGRRKLSLPDGEKTRGGTRKRAKRNSIASRSAHRREPSGELLIRPRWRRFMTRPRLPSSCRCRRSAGSGRRLAGCLHRARRCARKACERCARGFGGRAP